MARSKARLTTERVRGTLYAFIDSGAAASMAASPAAEAVSGVTRLPTIDFSAVALRQGIGATPERRILAADTVSPSRVRFTAASTSGQSWACFWRASYAALFPLA